MSDRRTTKWTFRLFVTPFHNAGPVPKQNEIFDKEMNYTYYPIVDQVK